MSKSNVCLVIIFNHKFEKNIEKLRRIYGERFSNIYFLMPFYQGYDKNVIPVYECSYTFQGYVAQGLSKYYNETYDHYIFIGDDLVLNPELNENNIVDAFNLKQNTCFIESSEPVNKCTYWPYSRIQQVMRAFKEKGTTYQSEIPAKEEAFKIVQEKGYDDFSMKQFRCSDRSVKVQIKSTLKKLFYHYDLPYPIFAGYSDFFIISKENIKEFSHICGVFAAMGLWVEMAVPTALRLIDTEVITNKDIEMEALCMWAPTPMQKYVEENGDYRIDTMNKIWPKNIAYIHPLKLSKWN